MTDEVAEALSRLEEQPESACSGRVVGEVHRGSVMVMPVQQR
jgi:hypothetical protein